MAFPRFQHGWPVGIAMEDTTKYGSSTVLLTSVIATKEKSNEIDGFPCVSPLDDGKNHVNIFLFIWLNKHVGERMFLLCLSNLIDDLLEGVISFLVISFIQFFYYLSKASDVLHEWNKLTCIFFRLLILSDRVIRHPLKSCNISCLKRVNDNQTALVLTLFRSR